MKNNPSTRRWGALALTLATTTLCIAAHAAEEKPYYAGATLGVAAIAPQGYELDRGERGEALLSGGLFAGVRVGTLPLGSGWPVHAEVGYQKVSNHTLPYKVNGGTTDLTASGNSFYLASKIDAPLTEHFSLYAKLGLTRNSVSSSTPDGQTPIDISGHKTSPLLGFGMQHTFDSGLSLGGELVSYGKSSNNSKAAGFNFRMAYAF